MTPGLFDLTGRVAAVTGASQGLGRAIAKALAAAGARVVCGARTRAKVEAVANEITAAGGEALAHVLDVTEPDSCRAFVAAAAERFGRFDIMMCNAGISIPRPAIETDQATWHKVIDVDLTGCFNSARAAGAWMIEHDAGGAIVATTSTAGIVGFPNLVAYAAAKGGVGQMVRTLAIEWAPHGIRVNAVAPGWMAHAMRNAGFEREDPRVKDEIGLTTPMRRTGSDEELAGPAVFLACDAASFITGVILPVDGGYVIA
ncbi:MAG: SDR family NAD(P)-dependent oxidoreductase [Alphaproteobacteria bacterium]